MTTTATIHLERGWHIAGSFDFAVVSLRHLLSFSGTVGWTKSCGGCGRNKHTSQFKWKSGAPGQKPTCNDCVEKLQKEKKE